MQETLTFDAMKVVMSRVYTLDDPVTILNFALTSKRYMQFFCELSAGNHTTLAAKLNSLNEAKCAAIKEICLNSGIDFIILCAERDNTGGSAYTHKILFLLFTTLQMKWTMTQELPGQDPQISEYIDGNCTNSQKLMLNRLGLESLEQYDQLNHVFINKLMSLLPTPIQERLLTYLPALGSDKFMAKLFGSYKNENYYEKNLGETADEFAQKFFSGLHCYMIGIEDARTCLFVDKIKEYMPQIAEVSTSTPTSM